MLHWLFTYPDGIRLAPWEMACYGLSYLGIIAGMIVTNR